MVTPRRALLSVSDKRGIVELASFLSRMNVEIISTGGTAHLLEKEGIPFIHISEYTSYPEMLEGRVKTLHPLIHGGILAVRDKHMGEAGREGIKPIDLVCVNLYPFEETVKRGAELDEAIENIDIGGVALIRAAAKNFRDVILLTDPDDYKCVMEELRRDGKVSLETRKRLAVKGFRTTADYDSRIDEYLSMKLLGERVVRMEFRNGRMLRYGENYHQIGEVFFDPTQAEVTLSHAIQLHGKQLSYTNVLDFDSALECVKDVYSHFDDVVVAIMKHTNPCGLATGSSLKDTLKAAWEGDPISAFGSIICTNTPFDRDSAIYLKDKFVEGILAPSFDDDALSVLKEKKRIMLLELHGDWRKRTINHVYRFILGGVLRQTRDLALTNEWKTVTKKEFPKEKMGLAKFSWIACKHVKSNAVVIAREWTQGFSLLSVGGGQPNRVDAIKKLAILKAIENLRREWDGNGSFEDFAKKILSECVLSSDAFFPFPDSIEESAKGWIQYIISPGGSIRDREVIETADKYGIAMIFTGMRHFLH